MDRLLPVEVLAEILSLATASRAKPLARLRRVSKGFRRAVFSVESVDIEYVRAPRAAAAIRSFGDCRALRVRRLAEADACGFRYSDRDLDTYVEAFWHSVGRCTLLKSLDTTSYGETGTAYARLLDFVRARSAALVSLTVQCFQTPYPVVPIEPSFPPLRALTYLCWSWTCDPTSSPAFLSGLTALVALRFGYLSTLSSRRTREFRDAIATLSQLTSLEIYEPWHLVAYLDAALPPLPNLRSLRVDGSPVPAREWEAVVPRLPRLETVLVRHSNDGFFQMPPPPRLGYCGFRLARDATAETVIAGWARCATSLHSLDVKYATQRLVRDVPALLPSLRLLRLRKPTPMRNDRTNYWQALVPVLVRPEVRIRIDNFQYLSNECFRLPLVGPLSEGVMLRPVVLRLSGGEGPVLRSLAEYARAGNAMATSVTGS